MKLALKLIAASIVMAGVSGAFAQATKSAAKPLQGEVVKMAWIDPLSGLMGPVGNNQLNSWKFFIDKFNANNPAGVKFEIVGMDNKLSPTESLNALKSATDQGIRYIIQGNGSSVALALVDAIINDVAGTTAKVTRTAAVVAALRVAVKQGIVSGGLT